jgi:hypothetical protein
MLQQLKLAVSGAQILFVAFGAMVLVPLLTGLNPALALLGAGHRHAVVSNHHPAQSADFFGLFVCLYRADYLFHQRMGAAVHHVRPVCGRFYVFCVCAADSLARPCRRCTACCRRW